MVKVWKDLSEMKATQLPKRLEGIRGMMQEVPKHNGESARKIYQRKEYVIYKVSNGFIVHNTKKKFEEGHTHLKGFEMSKTIIDNCIRKRLPKTRNHYLLGSVIRLSKDTNYIEEVKGLIEVRENKQKLEYVVKR